MNIVDDLNKLIVEVGNDFYSIDNERVVIMDLFEYIVGWKRHYSSVEWFLDIFKDKITPEMLNSMFFTVLNGKPQYLDRLFVERGADINGWGLSETKFADRGMWIFRNPNSEDKLNRILDHGWDINSQDRNGKTILLKNCSP